MNDRPEIKRGFCGADGLAAAALLLGVAVRVWSAWAGRCLQVPDTAVVALMARHMAELKDFPVFFYGQAYMGSLEPMASALMVRVLGSTGFAVALGPVLFAAAALFFLWRWARDAAGPWGGLAALLAGLFGPLAYFQYQAAPRGGYMVSLFVDALALFAAARMAARLRAGEKVGWIPFLTLGLLAGAGMWSNPIVVSALGVAVLLLLHGMRWTFWRQAAGIVSGLVGFVAGFSPWLVYNARHGWASLAMSQTEGHVPLREALRDSWDRLLILQVGEKTAAGAWPLVLALAALGLAAWGAAQMAAQRRRASRRENYARFGALLFCAVFAGVFAVSGFTRTNTARYWVPLVPGLAVLAAVACAAPGRRAFRLAAWTILGALVLKQGALCLPAVQAAANDAAAGLAAQREMGDLLERAGVDALMAPVQMFPLNFALDERFAVSNGKQKYYDPILRRTELSASPAYASSFGGIETLLRQLGVEWKSAEAGGHRILWGVQCPSISLRRVPAALVRAVRDASGQDWKGVLTDGNLDTAWSPLAVEDSGKPAALEWSFAEPQDVHSVQLAFSHDLADPSFDFARRIRLEAKVAGEWQAVLPDEPIIPLEWSVARAYYPFGPARLDYGVRRDAVEALRVVLLDTPREASHLGWRLAEIAAFRKAEGTAPPLDLAALDALGEKLRARNPDARVYASRWTSAQLLGRGWIGESRLAWLSDRVFPAKTPMRNGTMARDLPCVFVAEGPQAETLRETLAKLNVSVREETEGPWTIFAVEPGAWAADGLPPPVVWNGATLLRGNTVARVGEALRRLRAGGEPEETQRALLDEIVRQRPSALSALSEETVARLGGPAAAQARRDFASLPATPCATEFANGIRLEGIAVDPAEAPAGGEVAVRLHWSAGENFKPGKEVVFIHLRDGHGRIVAQDDYPGSLLLWGDAAIRLVPGECLAETRRIALPASAPSGPLDLAVGLYLPKNGRRVRVLDTAAPAVRRNAVLWPACLNVMPASP